MAAQFEVIENEDPRPQRTEAESQDSKAVDILLFLLKPLAQRTVVALANLFCLATVASVFWLCLAIVPRAPSILQLVGLGGYAAFIIAINVIARRK